MGGILFRKPKNRPEIYEINQESDGPSIPKHLMVNCQGCKTSLFLEDLINNSYVCTKCNYHFNISVRDRIEDLVDNNSFMEMYGELKSVNPINFPNYEEKIIQAMVKTKENEAVVCGTASICGYNTCIFVMNRDFMMGSMGSVVGEKITRIFEYATENGLPVIGFTLSGGARMQEGIISLMQMAKTSGAVKRHSDAGLLYVSVLTNPTTGGVTASFAMESDIILAEPGALIGFAGPRVIEQTIKQKLPKGFQTAEFLLKKGFVDAIINRYDQKRYLGKLLELHSKEKLI